jgi:hypothetical protein
MKVIVFAALNFMLAASQATDTKVALCSIQKDGSFNTLYVSPNAVQAHLFKGALLGACIDNCEKLCNDNNKCTIDDCAADGKSCLTTHAPVSCDDGVLALWTRAMLPLAAPTLQVGLESIVIKQLEAISVARD